MASINMNPILTTNAKGLFSTNSNGYTQGDAQDDPAVKFALCGGVVDAAATDPLFGGLPILETIPAGDSVLGSTISASTDADAPTGFSVFNQAFAGLTTPQSPCPAFLAGMSVNYYRLGSGARIPVALDPASITLEGELVSTTVYWDFTNNVLTTSQPGTQDPLPVKVLRVSTVNNKTVSYDAITGYATWVTDGVVALIQI